MTEPNAPDSDAPREARPRNRRIGRHLAAVAFGLAVIAGAEMVCRLAGWGNPGLQEDPFVGFSGTRPLFIKSDDGRDYIVPRVRQEYFARESFPVQKGEQTRRIFCLGGSTVQGRPWSIPTSLTTWLELALNEVDDAHQWDVINCGGISYASYRLVPILQECLQYEPDLIVICTGHNEFLEDRSYPQVLRSPLLQQTSRLRLVNLARSLLNRGASGGEEAADAQRQTLALETEPMLNFEGGLAAYHRDDPWREGVAEHYEVNLRRMIGMVRAAGLPVLLMAPASNLRDCPPFKWELPEDFDAGQEAQWSDLMSRATGLLDENPRQALGLLEQALSLDPANPLTHYQLGHAHRQLHDLAAARSAFAAARDLDVCPLRMTSPLRERLERVCDELQVPLLDMHALLEAGSRDGILGDEGLVDHIHPSIQGHQQIAHSLVETLAERGDIPPPPENWPATVQSTYETHLATLESAYFVRGQRMLEALRAWSKGRADGPAAAERFPERIAQPD